MKNVIFPFSLLLCWMGGLLLGFSLDNEFEQEAKDLIEQCERDLPRVQHCELTAVPEE